MAIGAGGENHHPRAQSQFGLLRLILLSQCLSTSDRLRPCTQASRQPSQFDARVGNLALRIRRWTCNSGSATANMIRRPIKNSNDAFAFLCPMIEADFIAMDRLWKSAFDHVYQAAFTARVRAIADDSNIDLRTGDIFSSFAGFCIQEPDRVPPLLLFAFQCNREGTKAEQHRRLEAVRRLCLHPSFDRIGFQSSVPTVRLRLLKTEYPPWN